MRPLIAGFWWDVPLAQTYSSATIRQIENLFGSLRTVEWLGGKTDCSYLKKCVQRSGSADPLDRDVDVTIRSQDAACHVPGSGRRVVYRLVTVEQLRQEIERR